jgi:8-amino-7-oxononanoate synthase
MIDAASRGAIGSGASHLVSGHDPEHDLLERALADFTGRERAMVFSTGYMANLGVITALAERDDLILQDRLNHASLIDAALLARTREFKRYPHNDADAAASALRHFRREHPQAGALIATDGVFSMDGDIAPVAALAELAQAESAWLVVDDAHGLGVIGAEGRGVCEQQHLDQKAVPVLIGTFGKAF